MYEKGTRFRVVKAGASLSWWVPIAPYTQQGASHKLQVGNVVVAQGYGYSGGSDGIDLPKFKLVDDDADGTFLTPAAEFSPNSWGSPVGGFLEQVS